MGILWLVALFSYMWGAATIEYKVFPYHVLESTYTEIENFVESLSTDNRTLWKRLKSEAAFDPLAFELEPVPLPIELDMLPTDTSNYSGTVIQHVENSAYYSDGSLDGYFLIFGSFAFDDTNWGVILLSTSGKLIRSWSIKPEEYEYKRPHIGMAISDNGDIATNTNGVLTSYNWCGEKNWESEWEKQDVWKNHDSVLGIDYHHDIDYENGMFHTFKGPAIISVDERTGEIVKSIHALDLISWARSQNLSIFDARFDDFYKPNELDLIKLDEVTHFDPFHFNKVDILDSKLAENFKIFKEGDNLVSMRELNLIFVVRPEEKKIIWHRHGLTSRQHDATFQKGFISVFDNNPFDNSGRNPRIMRLDIENQTRSVIYNLKQWGTDMAIRGNFELHDENQLLIFSDDDNGRIIAITLDETPRFVYENRVSEDKNLELRNMTYLSRGQVENWEAQCQ